MSERDDFSADTKRTLGFRVNWNCSRPGCGAPTSGPHSLPERYVNIGVAAHITAAAVGGPRYDATLTPEQRKSIENGIWLCAPCSIWIDRDEAAFPVELLQQWKRDAEALALSVMGRGQPLDQSAILSQLVETNARQADTNARQAETIAQLTLQIPTAPATTNTPDDKWKSDVERALKWSESGEPAKIESAKTIAAEIRADADFEQLSPVMRARIATALAVCAVKVGDDETAKTEVEEALRLHPENVACISNAAGIAVTQDDFERAITLALQVRDKEPHNENAALVLVQAWHHTGKPERVEEFLRENPWFLDLPHGLAVLAQLRRREGRYEETIQLAKRALKRNREDVQALEELFTALFYPLRDKAWNSSEWDYGSQTKRRLRRAEGAISRAVKILEKAPNKAKLHQALSNRASVRSAQEKTQAAFDDCDRVLHGDPTPENRDLVSLNKALILVHVGRAPEAIPLLESLQDERRQKEGGFALAYGYHVAGQEQKALEGWEKIWKPEKCDASEMMTAEMMVWVYRRQKNDEGAESVLKRAQEACPDCIEVNALEAQDKFDCGDIEGALALLRESVETCEQNGDESNRAKMLMRVADICYRVDRLPEAAHAWREVTWSRLLPPYRGPYLNALYRTGQLKDALEVARRIRQESGFVPRAAETEAAICAYMGDWPAALALWEELSRHEPNNSLHPINRTQTALQAEDSETARRALQEVSYEPIKNNTALLIRVSQMQAHLRMKEAIRFAFRARQIDFGNPKSHSNFVQVFLDSTNAHSHDEDGVYSDTHAADVLGLNEPIWGEVPCTIRLQPTDSEDKKEVRSITILNEEPFDLTHDVFGAQDDFARRLLDYARSPQDTFSVRRSPGEPEREYRIAEVLSPYVHAFQESGLKGSEWFGEQAGVWSINVENGFDQFFATLDALGQGFMAVMEQYVEWRFPLCTVGKVRSRSVFDLWFLVAQRPQWGVHAERGVTESFDQAIGKLEAHFDAAQDGKPILALESTALLALVHLGFADIIAPHFRLLVPQSIRRKIKKEMGETHAPHIPNNIFSQLLDFVDQQTEVLSAKAVIEFPAEDIQQWQRCIGQKELDSLLLAHEHGALAYSDDTVLREMARFHPGVESINTQHILVFLEKRGFISQESRYECLEKLAQRNFKHLLLSAHFYGWLVEKHGNVANDTLRAALRHLEAPMCNEEGAIMITASLIAKVYSSPLSPNSDVLDLCLLSLLTGRFIPPTIQKLKIALCHPRFGLTKNRTVLASLFLLIEAWEKMILGKK